MSRRKPDFRAVAVLFFLFGSPAAVLAGPPLASVEMQKALAQAELGPDDLRRFVHRTRMIYQLSYAEVMQQHLALKAIGNARIASADEPSSQVAPADRR